MKLNINGTVFYTFLIIGVALSILNFFTFGLLGNFTILQPLFLILMNGFNYNVDDIGNMLGDFLGSGPCSGESCLGPPMILGSVSFIIIFILLGLIFGKIKNNDPPRNS